jgi:hypothetical protein
MMPCVAIMVVVCMCVCLCIGDWLYRPEVKAVPQDKKESVIFENYLVG